MSGGGGGDKGRHTARGIRISRRCKSQMLKLNYIFNGDLPVVLVCVSVSVSVSVSVDVDVDVASGAFASGV